MKRLRGWLILIVVVILLFVFLEPIERFADALLSAPWAYGWDSRGNLTDNWTTALPSGQSLDMTLVRAVGADGLPLPADETDAALVGEGRVCGGNAGISPPPFTITGTSNRSGSHIRLTGKQPNTVVAYLEGNWTGDTIELSGNLFAQPTTLTLQRGATCP